MVGCLPVAEAQISQPRGTKWVMKHVRMTYGVLARLREARSVSWSQETGCESSNCSMWQAVRTDWLAVSITESPSKSRRRGGG